MDGKSAEVALPARLLKLIVSLQIGLLITSASIISSSVYFLWRITTFPELGNVDAILIGVAITCAFFLCVWGIGSGKGNPVESSLLVSLTTTQHTVPIG
jgi:hypothetical protein